MGRRFAGKECDLKSDIIERFGGGDAVSGHVRSPEGWPKNLRKASLIWRQQLSMPNAGRKLSLIGFEIAPKMMCVLFVFMALLIVIVNMRRPSF